MVTLFFCLAFSHKGEGKERRSRGVRFERQQLTPQLRHAVAVSRSHPHTCTRSKDAYSATQLLTKYSQRDSKVHWESSGSLPAAEDVWSTVAWRRVVLAAAQTTICRQRASALTIDTDTSMTYIRVWSDLFLIYFTECVCVCGVNNTAGLIFILEEETWCKLFALIAAVGEGTFSFSLLGGERNGWALCSTLFCLLVCHLPVPIIYCRKPEKVLCLQGCQVLIFFF